MLIKYTCWPLDRHCSELEKRFLVIMWTGLFYLLLILSILNEVILSQPFLLISKLFEGDQEKQGVAENHIFLRYCWYLNSEKF